MDGGSLSIKKIWWLMLKKLSTIIAASLYLALFIPQTAVAEFVSFSCELYGEEGISSDLWLVDPSRKIAIHQAGSKFGKIYNYELKYRVDIVDHRGMMFSIPMFDEYANRIYNLGIPSSFFNFINGGVHEAERSLRRRLTLGEKEALKEVIRKMNNARLYVVIDFTSLKFSYVVPPIKFDLSKTDKFLNVRPYETDELINEGQCQII